MEMLVFTSENGREYVLDNSTNKVFPLSVVAKTGTICTKDGLRICQISELTDEAKRWKGKFGCFSDRNIGEREVSFSEYKEYIGLFRGDPLEFLQLILIITEDCNLRCAYCTYSGIYEYDRVHSRKSMPFLVAKKSIDYFVTKHFFRIRRINPTKRLVIGFYGGEPLLEFDLIRRIMKYCSDEYPNLNIMWHLTVNGTLLLSREIVRFLVENDVCVAVSLDGPEEEHNRNRIYRGGKGSFSEVFEGIIRLKEEIKNQGKEHILPYLILTCYDTKTNLEKVNDFFVTNVETLGMAGRVNAVREEFTTYFDNFTPAEEQEFYMRCRILEERYFDAVKRGRVGLKDSFLEKLIGAPLRQLYIRMITADGRHLCRLIGGCIPGSKIAVDCDGNFHTCEKMNFNFPIGNYTDGIEIPKVEELMQKWKEATKKCIQCPISGVCGICYPMCATDDKFDRESICLERKNSLTYVLCKLYSLLEENPRSYEYLSFFESGLKEKVKKYDDFMKMEY